MGAASDFFSFMQLHALTGSVIVSNFFSFILGTTVNLLICKYFVFGRSYNGFKGLISLYVMTCGVVFLVTIYIQFSQEMLGLKVAKLSSFVFSYILNYGIRRFFIFSK